MTALWGLLRKEGYHILRDRRTLAVIVFMPVVQVVLFGYSIRTDVDGVRLAIVDPAPDYATIALRGRFAAAGVFETVAVLQRTADLDALFQTGAAQQAIVFQPGFGDRLARGMPAGLLLATDATEPNTGTVIQSYALAVIDAYSAELQAESGTAGGGGVRIIPQIRMRFNPTLESSNLFVPGLLAMVLTITAALMTALSLTREKETGTMEALLVSPLRPWQIIVGKVAPYVLIAFVSTLAVLLEARIVFGVPLRGSFLLLLGEGLLFILVSLSLGMLISARTSSQRVAMMGALLGTMLPTMMLSGFIFPVESMPRVLQWLANVVPARWFVVIARGIMLKGVGLTYLWDETLILLGMAAALLVLSTRAFRVRLE